MPIEFGIGIKKKGRENELRTIDFCIDALFYRLMYNNVFEAEKRVSCYFNGRICIYIGVDILRLTGCIFCLKYENIYLK